MCVCSRQRSYTERKSKEADQESLIKGLPNENTFDVACENLKPGLVRITKEDIHINFKILLYLLYLNIILHEIKIKICKIYTTFPVFFANFQCCIAEFYIV